jgi:hypothetical protein
MEGSGGFGFPFGGDPEDLMRSLREFAEQQAESVQEAQREQFATLTLNTAVELTAAALQQIQATGGADEQALALRDAMRVLFPEAVALVSREPATGPDQPAAERQAYAVARRNRGPVAAQASRPCSGGFCADLVLKHSSAPLDPKYLDLEPQRYTSILLTSRLSE